MAFFEIVFTLFLLTLAVATHPSGDENIPRNDIIKSALPSVSLLERQNCDYHDKTFVLNCSNMHLNLNILENMQKPVYMLDVSDTALTKMMEFSRNEMFKQLKTLNASKNNMEDIEDETFHGLIYLENLDLSCNKLRQLPNNLFVDLMELKYLNISNNLLTTLPVNIPMLDWLDVSYNQIASISETLSTVLYPQQIVLMAGNPFVCDHRIMWLKEWLNTRMYLIKYVSQIDPDKFIPTCSHPENLKGKQWTSIEDREFHLAAYDESADDGKVDKEISVQVEDIDSHSLVVKWTTYSKVEKTSIEIKYHKFGHSKNVNTIVIPLTSVSYRLKNLEADSAYIICFTLVPDPTEEIACKEIMTSKEYEEISNSKFYAEKVLLYFSKNLYQFISIIVISFITVYFLRTLILKCADAEDIKKD